MRAIYNSSPVAGVSCCVLQVQAEELPDISMRCEVSAVPTFVFFRVGLTLQCCMRVLPWFLCGPTAVQSGCTLMVPM